MANGNPTITSVTPVSRKATVSAATTVSLADQLAAMQQQMAALMAAAQQPAAAPVAPPTPQPKAINPNHNDTSSVTLENGILTIRVPFDARGHISSTGKSTLHATLGGKTHISVNGRPLSVSLSAFTK